MNNIIKKVLTKLESNGYEAYVIGGYVRDKLIGRTTFDVDITTNALPKDLYKLFNIKPNKYGSINFKIKKYNIVITTYREEFIENNTLKIKYVNNLLVDLSRRDFTINTICMNKDNVIIDSLNGRVDINKKLVKMIDNPDKRLIEDPLRIMRAIRFATILNFKIDDDLLNSIKTNNFLVSKINKEKLRLELDKILLSKHYKYGLSLIKELDIDKHLNLNYECVKKTKDLLGMYYQITTNNKELFNKIEYNTIKALNEIDEINVYSLYKYGLYINLIKAEILNVDSKEVHKIYNNMYLNDKLPLKINSNEIMSILNIKPSKELRVIKEDVVEMILLKKLKNNNKKIKKYIKDKYE